MAKEKICGVYKIENLVNGKVYIGQSEDIIRRWRGHKSELKNNKKSNKYLQNSWNKYGENNFNFSIIEECSIDNLSILEDEWIKFYDSINIENGYNLQTGGILNKKLSKESKKKMSDNHFNANGENNSNTKLTNEQVLIIKEEIRQGGSSTDLSLKFNVSWHIIDDIKNNRTWTSVGELIYLPNDIKEYYKIKNRNKNITEDIAINIIELLIDGYGNKEISNKLNVSVKIIDHIKHKNTWKHLSQDIVFPNKKRKNKL